MGRALVMAMVVVVALSFILQPPVQAQTATALLSNLGQVSTGGSQYTDKAQPFRTGTNTDGYVLTSIEINTTLMTTSSLSDLPTLKVHSGSATGTEVAALTAPSSASATLTYTAPANTNLIASTTYWVVSTGGASGFWAAVGADLVDSGAANGWSLPGRGQEKSGTTYANLSAMDYFKIRVNGYARTADQPGTVSLSVTQPQVDVAVTATLTDPDGGVTGTMWQWSSASTADGTYTDITDAALPSYTPGTGDVGNYLKATASYNDTHGVDKSAEKVSDNAVVATVLLSNLGQAYAEQINITNTVAQRFRTGANTHGYALTSIEINTDVTTGTTTDLPTLKLHSGSPTGTVVATLTVGSVVTDSFLTYTAPANTTLSTTTTYWVVATDSMAHWNMTSTTTLDSGATGWSIPGRAQWIQPGGTTFIQGSALYFKLRVNGYARTTAADQAGAVSLSTTQPQVDAAVTATLTDPDGGVTGTMWQWSSASTADGTYTAITEATSASYTPESGDVGNYLKATASYTDGQGSGKSAEQVSDNAVIADTPGTVTLSPTQPEMGIPITATLADDDGEITGTTWQWSSSDTASGSFTDITGAASATYRPAEADLTKFLQATASYTDSLGSGKSASATSTSAVTVVEGRVLLDTNSHRIFSTAAGGPGITTLFKTGNHPEGYKLSDVSMEVSGAFSTDTVSMHIYSASTDSSRTPIRACSH